MLGTLWKSNSLRYWVAIGMTVALAPLAISVIGGFFLFNHGVVKIFKDVASRHLEQIVPTQQLRLQLADSLELIVEHEDEGADLWLAQYRALDHQIDTGFTQLQARLTNEPEARSLVQRAWNNWTVAAEIGSEIQQSRQLSDQRAIALATGYRERLSAASDYLEQAYTKLDAGVGADYQRAIRSYENALWLSALAAIISIIAVIFGVIIISRIISTSVDKLVGGAALFAAGDRTHRIEVEAPPELKRVAGEFNTMIERIQDSETALADLARRDALTQLFNRRAFDEALAEMHARIQRDGEEGSLIMLDIDHFKRVNDTYGHPAGDDTLRNVAQIIVVNSRPFDHAYRTGGEEFAVLLPGVNIDDAREMAERMRVGIAANHTRANGNDISITVSIGVAKASAALTPKAVLEAADAALYFAKSNGRNRVAIIDEFGCREAAPPRNGSAKIINIATK